MNVPCSLGTKIVLINHKHIYIYICRADFLTRKLKVALLAGHLYFTSTVTVIFPGRRRKRLFPCRLSQHMFQNNFNFKAQCSRWYQ